jgi:hypothetical protein
MEKILVPEQQLPVEYINYSEHAGLRKILLPHLFQKFKEWLVSTYGVDLDGVVSIDLEGYSSILQLVLTIVKSFSNLSLSIIMDFIMVDCLNFQKVVDNELMYEVGVFTLILTEVYDSQRPDSLVGITHSFSLIEQENRLIGGYTVDRKIGEGSYSTVYRLNGDQENVAFKVFHSEKYMERELCALSFLSDVEGVVHPQKIIMAYPFGFFLGGYTMPLCENGTLWDYCKSHNPTTREIMLIMKRLLTTMRDFHSRGILHGDIKPGNILISSDCKPYIADFGLAMGLEKGKNMAVSKNPSYTPEWQDPHNAMASLEDSHLNFALCDMTDLWAVCLTIFSILANVRTYLNNPMFEVFQKQDYHEQNSQSRINDAIDLVLGLFDEDRKYANFFKGQLDVRLFINQFRVLDENPSKHSSCVQDALDELTRLIDE